MAEEKKNPREIDEKIAEMVLGKEYTATVKLERYEFQMHSPTIKEQIQIIMKSKDLRLGVKAEDDSITAITDMLATLDVSIDSIKKKDKEGKFIAVKGKFLSVFGDTRKPGVFTTIINPLYQKYLEFIAEVNKFDEDELKND